MNRTAFAAAHRATAFALAAVVTLSILGGINGLATQQHAATELARAQQPAEPAAAGAKATAVALVMAPRS